MRPLAVLLLLASCIDLARPPTVDEAWHLDYHGRYAQRVEDAFKERALDDLHDLEREFLRSAWRAGKAHATALVAEEGRDVAHLLHLIGNESPGQEPDPDDSEFGAVLERFPSLASAAPALRLVLLHAHRLRPTALVYTCHRSLEDEERAHARGRSQIDPKRSAHVKDPAEACDRVPFANHESGGVDWTDLEEMHFRAGVEAVVLVDLQHRGLVDPGLCMRDVEDWTTLADPLHVEIAERHCVLEEDRA